MKVNTGRVKKTFKFYSDEDVGDYVREFPVAQFADREIDLGDVSGAINSLQANLYYQLSDEGWRQKIFFNMKTSEGIVDQLKEIISNYNSQLKIQHISIGGSYLYKDVEQIGDIDFNVIVEGSYFAFLPYYNLSFLKKYIPHYSLQKISFLFFGADNLFKGVPVNDDLKLGKNFLQKNMVIREGMVFALRNGTIYGKYFKSIPTNKYNLLIRLKRQLYLADLILRGEIEHYQDDVVQRKKATKRIYEAAILLAYTFPELSISAQDFFQKETLLSVKHIYSKKELKALLYELTLKLYLVEMQLK